MAKSMGFLLAAALIGVIALSLGTTVEAARKAPPPKPSSGPFPFITCPSTPLAVCDFYLFKMRASVPTFKVARTSQDKPLSNNTLVANGYYPVIHASTMGNCYFVPEYKKTDPKCAAAFYFMGKKLKNGKIDTLHANMVASRTTVNFNLNKYQNKCVVLPVATATIQLVAPKGKTPGKYLYLNSKDGNKDFPEARRCIVFKTVV